SQGAAKASPPVPQPQAARVPRRPHVLRLTTGDWRLVTATLWDGPIAQRLEPPAHNRPVPGSNPGGPIFALACDHGESFGGQAPGNNLADARRAEADKPRCASAGAFFVYER